MFILQNLTFFSGLVNSVLASGAFPDCFKHGIIKPLLKHTLDCNELNSYQPITNLPYFSKLLEKIVLPQRERHMDYHELWPLLQSAYRRNHSTETSLLFCFNFILPKISMKRKILIITLDLSSAFDTVQHQILLTIMKSKLGIDGAVLSFFTSFLKNRYVSAAVGNEVSEVKLLEWGVPQGPILGPILFSIHLLPLFDVLNSLEMTYHFYADDGQLLVDLEHFNGDLNLFLHDISNCFSQLQLKLNANKTTLTAFSSRHSQFVSPIVYSVDENLLHVQKSVKVFDSNMTLENNIHKVCQSCNLELRKLFAVRKQLGFNEHKLFATAFILSRSDYCNSLYLGLPDVLLRKLQRVLNMAARYVFDMPKYSSTSGLLQKLHWLPVQYRMKFKVGILMHKTCIPASQGIC